MGRRDRSPDRDDRHGLSRSCSRSRSRSRTPKGNSEKKSGRNRMHKEHKQDRERHVTNDKRQVSRRRSRSTSKERAANVKRRKEECLKARDNLEDYCYDLKSELKTNPAISVENQKEITTAVKAALELIDDDSKQDAEEFVAELKDLEHICYPITNMLAKPTLEQSKTSDSDDNPDIKERAILRAEVVAIQPYGVFVQLGRYHRGLVHISQVDAALEFNHEDADDEKVRGMEWAAPKGSRVWVKVLEIRDDEKIQGGKRISCSMKLVSQESGADLDKDGKLAKRASIYSQGYTKPAY